MRKPYRKTPIWRTLCSTMNKIALAVLFVSVAAASSIATLAELEIHISTLEPGKSPHAPHQHQHEELLIIKDGTLETFQSGARRKVGPGVSIFQASNELHNVTNVGQFPATYYVIVWTVPRAALTK